jgi:H+/Cl- antiporter ClcA
MQLQMLIALAMVGYLAAVTQSPITSFVIVMEMINGHALVISLMATALISSRVARLFAPPLYEALAHRYMTPAAAQAAPSESDTPKTLEPLFEDEKAQGGKDVAQP